MARLIVEVVTVSELNAEHLLELPAEALAPRRTPHRRPLADAPSQAPQQIGAVPTSAAPLIPVDDIDEIPTHLNIALAYIGVAIVCQLLLLIPIFTSLRIIIRIAPFLLSTLLAAFPPRKMSPEHRLHPAIPFAGMTVAVIMFGMFNVETDSMIAGLAVVGFHIAILSPLLWASRLQLGPGRYGTVVLVIWLFSAASAGAGVLQVLFPGRFDPAISSIVQDFESEGVTLNITLADGTTMHRPFGLTDTPGGAATAGVASYVFGLGLLVASRRIFMRALYLVGMGAGLFVIYLAQVRASLVMCGIATVTFVGIMTVRGEFKRLTGSLAALSVVIALSTAFAFYVGGYSMLDRIFTLVEDDAGEVYYSNRGKFLDYTFSVVLPNYPFGAGLGRYGMMNRYFGKDKGAGYGVLWAEIQWTAWVYDGGWLMIILYPLALIVAMWAAFKNSLDRTNGEVGLWGAILFAYNMSAIAVLFSYPLFLSQAGLEFWLFNGLLYSAAQVARRKLHSNVPVGFENVPAVWQPGSGMLVLPTSPSAEASAASSKRRSLTNRAAPAIIPTFGKPPPQDSPSA